MPDADALRVLEIDRLLTFAAERTQSAVGKRAILETQPAPDLAASRSLLAETRQALHCVQSNRLPALAIKDDVIPLLDAAAASGVPLLARELAALFRFVKRARRLREFLSDLEEGSELWRLGKRIPDLGTLNRELEDAIDEQGLLLDSATAKLRALRIEISERRESVRRSLEKFARRVEVRSVIRSIHPAIRDGRYVLAVRSGARGQVKGLYHDRSATGQTSYVEPELVIDDQNRLRDLEIDEQREVNRILIRLTRLAWDAEDAITEVAGLVARVDIAFARAFVARDLGLVEPELNDGGPLVAIDVRHPWLLALAFDRGGESGDPSLDALRAHAQASVVPFSLTLGDTFDILVLTGPNTGGKTATLKALGLLALLPRYGWFLPTAGPARIPFFRGVFADVGDEQDLAQSLSTFSGHVKRVARILAAARQGSLVLLDELGSGTDPLEGEALATSLLEAMIERGILAVVTTHLGRLKQFAGKRSRAANASMQFDPDTLRPTFRLLLGVPGASNALRIARNLGLDPQIVEAAERELAGSGDRTAELFSELDRSRAELEKLREQAARDRDDAQRRAATVKQRESALAHADAALLLHAEAAAEARLKAFAEEIEEPRRQLLALGGKAALAAGRIVDALRRMHSASPLAEHRRRFLRSLKPGDSVKLVKMNENGVVKKVWLKDDRLEVVVRHLSITVKVDDIAPSILPS